MTCNNTHNPTQHQLHSPPGLQHERAVGEREPDLPQPDAEGAGDHVGPRVQHQRLQQPSLSTVGNFNNWENQSLQAIYRLLFIET